MKDYRDTLRYTLKAEVLGNNSSIVLDRSIYSEMVNLTAMMNILILGKTRPKLFYSVDPTSILLL